MRAALTLWAERGFERGVEETTVEEIARAAGVTKGTFYFHFAHKEDILLELGWGTAEVLYDEVLDGVTADRPAEEILDGLLVSLARRVESVPKMATLRTVEEFNRPGRHNDDPRHFGIQRAFTVAFEQATRQGVLPPAADAGEAAIMLEVLAMDAFISWARFDVPLLELLRQRAAVVLAGARQTLPVIRSRRPPAVEDSATAEISVIGD